MHAGGIIINGIHPDENNSQIMMQQFINAGNMQKWMASIYAPVTITKRWTIQEYISFANTHLINPGAFDIQRNLIFINTNMQYNFGNNFTATFHAYWLNQEVAANAVIRNMWQMDIGLQKKFFNRRLTAKISADDIFNTHKEIGTFYYNNFNLNFTNKEQTQKITLGVTYNFNLGKVFQSRKIESSSEEEKSRLR
jgi:hypothetical protein